MKYRVILQPRARQDIEAQYRQIAIHSPSAAANWFNRILTALEGLSRMPERCAIARESDLVGREIRQFLFGKRAGVRSVLFVIKGDIVRILAVRHSAQSEITAEDLWNG